METGDLVRDHARREVLHLAAELTRDALVDTSFRVLVGARLLDGWAADDQVRAAFRPLFAAAVPDQRALLALGDIDVWLRDGRIARGWWERAAAGPDPELAALGAWRSARALLRGGRADEALPLLRQATAAGVLDAALRLGRLVGRDGDDEAAAELFRRAGPGEGELRLAELRLRADDVDGAERAIHRLRTMPYVPGAIDLQAWEEGVRGEIAFRRGYLDAAEVLFERAGNAPGDRPRCYELRLAQIAIPLGDAGTAYSRIIELADSDGAIGLEARDLMQRHADLIAAGAPIPDEPDGGVGDGEDDDED